jgi:hypothetical protein
VTVKERVAEGALVRQVLELLPEAGILQKKKRVEEYSFSGKMHGPGTLVLITNQRTFLLFVLDFASIINDKGFWNFR